MPHLKFRAITLSCITIFFINACSPSVLSNLSESGANSQDNILNILDPNIKTESQAMAMAEQAFGQGKDDNALFYYVKALQYNNKNIKALEQIAVIHNRSNHPELALKVYKEILAIDSRNLAANEYLGLYYLNNGSPGKAKEHLTAVVSQNNKNWKAHNGLGVIADLAHNTKEAIAHYEAALAVEPADPMLLNNLGYSYYLSGDPIKAKYYFTQSLNYDKKYSRAIHNLALLEIKNGNFTNAAALFNRIMPVYESYNNIGYICMLNGQYDYAEEYLRRAIDESPVYFPKAEENLKTLSSLKPRQMTPFNPDLNDLPPPVPTVKPRTWTSPDLSPAQDKEPGTNRSKPPEATKKPLTKNNNNHQVVKK